MITWAGNMAETKPKLSDVLTKSVKHHLTVTVRFQPHPQRTNDVFSCIFTQTLFNQCIIRRDVMWCFYLFPTLWQYQTLLVLQLHIIRTYRKDDVEEDQDIFAKQATSIQSHDEPRFVTVCKVENKLPRRFCVCSLHLNMCTVHTISATT